MWVGSQEFTIHPVPYGHKTLDGAIGITTWDPPAIHYAADRRAREIFDTVWHELTHAVNDVFELVATRKRLTEERVAKVHGHGWTQVLLENPALLEWLDLMCNFIKSEQENLEA